jgi:signal peptidase I
VVQNAQVDIRKLGKGLLWTAIIVGGIVGAVRFLALKTWTVPSDDPALSASIAPSLAPGDLVLVLHRGTPGFGDLVRCTDPDEPQRWVIGRIVGEAGDIIEIEGGKITINGKRAPEESACKEAKIQVPHPQTGSPVELRCSLEEVGAVLHKRALRSGEMHVSTSGLVKRTVPPDTFFLVSDNRVFQNDSTVFGAVPVETCDARIIFRVWGSEGFSEEETRFEWIH